MIERVLAIETSCDDTSVAIVRRNGFVEALTSLNQDKVHKPFGGIVPEIASRNHTLHLIELIERALDQAKFSWTEIGGIVVTARPGLIGSLLVGVVTAKTLAWTKNLPFIGVNHLEGHLLAPFLKDAEYTPEKDFTYPYVALAVSGGHSQLYEVLGLGEYKVLGRTLDDAAGEAYDKFAKLIGLDFPGGPRVDNLAQAGKVTVEFPRPMLKEDNFNFSFSGIKAAAARYLSGLSPAEIEREKHNLCASFQAAVTEVLIYKLSRAVKTYNANKAVLTGGVSANSHLRSEAALWAKKNGIRLIVPPIRYCTDNAAMIGYAGILRLNRGERSEQDIKPLAESLKSDFA
jgi:N6-L-threonylcarbamoyladenine synthase